MFESIKALGIKTSMLFNLDFANNCSLSYFFFCFLVIDLYFFTSCGLIPTMFQYNSKLYKLFCASNSLIHFGLFLQLNNFLFHLFFWSKFLLYIFFRYNYISLLFYIINYTKNFQYFN